MPFDWKDLISPVVTVTAVWLGARLALNNDIRKKALELEAERLERLAVECHSAVSNLNKYCLRLWGILHDLSDGYSRQITAADLSRCLEDSAKAGAFIDIEAAHQFQNTLELHRQADFEEWKERVIPLLNLIHALLPAPSLATADCTEELSRMYGSPEHIKTYNDRLAELAGPLSVYRQELFARIARDYRTLLHPASPNIWVMMRKAWRTGRDFVRYIPSAPGNTRQE